MKNAPHLFAKHFLCLALASTLSAGAHAAVTNVIWYRLGENDPGAASGVAVPSTTTDLIGLENLKQFAGPLYTNAVSPGASNHVGSALAVQFNGTSQYLSNGVVSTVVDNFGIEAWVRPDTTIAGNHFIAYNGNSAANGWGLLLSGTKYSATFAGAATFGANNTATAGTWAHVALVRVNGTATLYVNGVSAATGANTPLAVAGGFAVGAPPQAPTSQYFSGAIDEVRVFTFSSDLFTLTTQFSTNDLLFNLQRVTTLGVPAFNSTNATLSGAANPPGLPTTVWFEWGTTIGYGNITPTQSFDGSTGSTNFIQNLTGLTGGITYQYRAVASNSLGLAYGTNQSFTTPAPPTVSTLPATDAGPNSANFNGVANPNGLNTTVWFQFGTDTNYGGTTSSLSVGGGTSNTNFSQVSAAYSIGTTLQFRAVASNSVGVVFGTNQNYTFAGPPTVATLPPTAIGVSAATLNGVANPEGAATTVWFQWGVSSSGSFTNATPSQAVGSGLSNTNFNQMITGLTPGVGYTFYAVAQSALGVVSGINQSFIIPAPPGVSTLPATAVGATNATLNGFAMLNGASVNGWFEWGTTTNYGNVTSAQLVDGASGSTSFSQLITGLSSGLTYQFRAVVSNSVALVFGANQSFTTAAAPTVSTLPATYAGPNSANLNGVANPDGLTTTAWFQYGTTTNYDGVTSLVSVGSGTSNTNFSQVTPAYSVGTTLQSRAVASNNLGVVFGVNQSYTITSPPTVATLPASGVGPASATFNGVANPQGANTTVWFQWGSVFNPITNTSPQIVGAGNSNTNFSQVITGLTAGITYSYLAIASNSAGAVFSTNQSFITPIPPTVSTLPATAVGATNATLNGSAVPNGASTSGWFEWGTTTNYGNVTVAQAFDIAPGTKSFSQVLTGLSVGVTYNCRAVASNSIAVVTGTNQTFVTPSVATLPASRVGTLAATLNGAANPAGAGAIQGYFEWGTTTNYSSVTSSQPLGNGADNTNFNQVISGLTSGATYNFRAVTVRSADLMTIRGTNQSFTTLVLASVTTLPATAVGLSTATFNGVANPQGTTTTVWFQWLPPGSPSPTNTLPQTVGNGNSNTNFSQIMTGLAAGTTYSYLAVASNSAGVVFSTNQSFTTLTPPGVSTLPATLVAATNATLNGFVMPNGANVNGWFEWGTTTNYGNVTSVQLFTAIGGNTAFSQLLTGLSGGVTYNFRAVASNSFGLAFGTNQSFATPSVATLAATTVGTTNATLNGAANPAGADTQGYFEWGTTTSYGNVTPSQALGSGTGNTNFSRVITGLTSGVTYNFRAVTVRTADSVIIAGTNQSFTTLVLPSVTTLSPSTVGLSAATLNGMANPQGAATTVWFEWGTKPNQLTNSTSLQAAGNGLGNTNFSDVIVGLSAGSLYYFRAAASNSAGTVRGGTLSFSTPTPPTVATLPASAVGPTDATLNGTANPQGVNTIAWFEWGTTTNYGNVTPQQSVGSGGSDTNFSQIMAALTGGTTYNFRAIASNNLGLVYGTNQSFSTPVFALAFTNLPGISQGSVAWGNYDNDGRLDILLTGNPNVAQLWRNNAGSGFSNINAEFSFTGQQFTSVAWRDYDNDGRLDFLFAGADLASPFMALWQNTGSGFVGGAAAVSQVGYSSVAWGDYDNDGRPDILLAGKVLFSLVAEVWRNTGNGFSNINAGLPGFRDGSVVWGDFDNDGRLDIFLSGDGDSSGNGVSGGLPGGGQIWRNTGNGFSNINANLPGVYRSSVALGDYDNDGRLDILLSGSSGPFGGLPITQVWRNTGNGFSDINAGLPGISRGSVVWGDYDNDGRLDILLTGTTNGFASGAISQIWRNTGNGFSNINANLPGVAYSSAAWGDYDNDGRLDILLTGQTTTTQLISQVWRNNTPLTNTPPTAPTGLTATIVSNGVSFNWIAASDAQTPASGLTYNLRVGSTPGGSDLLAPMASTSGLRRLPQLGPKQGLTALFNYTLGTPYYWSVQAIDSSFAGSPFAAEGSFKILQAPPVFVPPTATNIVAGDANGDGIVSQSELAAVLAHLNGNGIVNQSELNLVLSNYFPYSPWLYMTNVAGLGGTNVTFALSNSIAGAFSVEYTTNLLDWFLLGPATPRYLFTDTNAPAIPQRFYRLRWP